MAGKHVAAGALAKPSIFVETIAARYLYDEAEAIRMTEEVSRATLGSRRRPVWIGVFLILVAAAVGVFGGYNAGAMAFSLVPGLLLVSLPLITRVLIRYGAKRRAAVDPSKGQNIRWEMDAKELRSKTDGSTVCFVWNKLVKIQEVQDGFLLFIQPKLAYWIPKHAFATEEDVATMRRLIRGSGVEFRE